MSRARRWAALAFVGLGAVPMLAGCTTSDRAAIRETATIRHSEVLIASYAATHDGGRDVGRPAGCEARIVGESDTGTVTTAYLELLCSALSGQPRCERNESTAFVSEATAALQNSEVTGISIDTENDAGEYRWVQRHFASQWQHLEKYGPQYGDLLDSRLRAQFPCH